MTTKENILSLINSNDFISGEDLALKCQVSRAAVNKAINALRTSGYHIEAVTNKGYRLQSAPDSLSQEKITSYLTEKLNEVLCYDSLDSTMLEGKRLTTDKKIHKVLVVTDQQTAGRGRMGRTFVSPKGTGVYFSLIYSPEGGVKNPAFYTAAASVAVSRAVKDLYGEECQIKWVNDVFLGGKKICGILTEGVANFETGRIDTAVVGIGINVRNCHFEGELSKTAGSIEEIMAEQGKNPVSPERNRLVASVINHLVKIYDNSPDSSQMLAEYRQRSLLTGLTVTVNPLAGLEGNTYRAKVVDITDNLELLVELEDGSKRALYSGEVSLKSSAFTKQV